MNAKEGNSRPPLPCTVSDVRPSFSNRIAGALLPLCVTLMALSLLGSAVLVWATYR